MDQRIFAREPVDNGREQAGGNALGAANAQFPTGRIGEKLKLLHAVLEFVENRNAAIDQHAAIRRWLDAVAAAVEQAMPHRVLHIGNRFRYRGLRNCKLGSGLGHAAALHHAEQNMQIAKLEAASDAIGPLHAAATLSKWLWSSQTIELDVYV